jgi:uncharacterized protein
MRPSSETGIIVVAKAPIPGRVKTRLAADLGVDGERLAADLAAAALLDTLRLAQEWVDNRVARSSARGAAKRTRGVLLCALDGDLSRAARADQLARQLKGWVVRDQRGSGLAARIAHAHLDFAEASTAASVQIGMDTPQLTFAHLDSLVAKLTNCQAALGPANDGGWWALALRDSRDAARLIGVPMSSGTTGAATAATLQDYGLSVGWSEPATDVDTLADLAEVVQECRPDSCFAQVANALLAVH